MSRPATADAALAAAIRAEAGTIVASLHRLVGDFDVAEEAVQDAVVEALRHWRSAGIPDNPGAWLQVAAGRNAMGMMILLGQPGSGKTELQLYQAAEIRSRYDAEVVGLD